MNFSCTNPNFPFIAFSALPDNLPSFPDQVLNCLHSSWYKTVFLLFIHPTDQQVMLPIADVNKYKWFVYCERS